MRLSLAGVLVNMRHSVLLHAVFFFLSVALPSLVQAKSHLEFPLRPETKTTLTVEDLALESALRLPLTKLTPCTTQMTQAFEAPFELILMTVLGGLLTAGAITTAIGAGIDIGAPAGEKWPSWWIAGLIGGVGLCFGLYHIFREWKAPTTTKYLLKAFGVVLFLASAVSLFMGVFQAATYNILSYRKNQTTIQPIVSLPLRLPF